MKLQVAARVLVGSLLLALSLTPAWSDTLVVRGRRVNPPARFVVVGDEVYAPLLPALSYLGADYEVTTEAIHITTASGRDIFISRKRPEATRDGALREMPGLPRQERGAWFLPARAVGSLLDCAVRWEVPSRTLYLYPWVRRFKLETLDDRYRLTVAAESPIAYRTGELSNPPRLYLDLLDMDLAQIPSEYVVANSYLKSARIHQNSLAPAPAGDVARIVIEMSEERQSRIRESEDKCKLEVELPLPDISRLPPDAPPVILTGLSFERASTRLAAVKVGVYGDPYYTSVVMYDPTIVAVDIANAQSQIRPPLPEITDQLVSSVAIAPTPGQPGSRRVTIKLRSPISHSIVVEGGEVQILLGRLELAELKVVIDAGHGGHDTGAVGRSGLREKDVNIDIAQRVHRLLKEMGVDAVLTRPDNDPVRPWTRGNREEQRAELMTRCRIANDMDADLFVSIHSNARQGNPMESRGTETYYRRSESLDFCRVMQQEVVKALGLPDGGVIRHPKSIIVLSYTQMPAALVEVGYLSHPDDEALLATDETRQHAAQGIVNGIRRYVEEGGLLPQLARRERKQPPSSTIESVPPAVATPEVEPE